MMSKILNFLRILSRPLRREWPFILIFTIMVAPTSWFIIGRLFYILEASIPSVSAIASALFFGYLLAWILTVCRQRTLRIILKVIFYGAGLALYYLHFVTEVLMDQTISPITLQLIVQTNPDEAEGFLDTFVWPELPKLLLIGALFIIGAFVLEKYKSLINSRISRIGGGNIRKFAIGGALGLLALGTYENLRRACIYSMDYETLNQWITDNWYNHNTVTSIIYSVQCMNRTIEEYNRWEQRQRNMPQASTPDKIASDSLRIVFVLGESYNRLHSQLYGYRLPTTPRQCREMADSALVRFDDYATIGKTTSEVICNSFCLNSFSDGENWNQSLFFPRIMSEAGWDVRLYDNNISGKAVYNSLMRTVLMSDYLRDNCFSEVVVPPAFVHDIPFLAEPLSRPLPKEKANSLTIFHIYGQHIPFSRAVYDGVDRFKASDYEALDKPWLDDKRRATIADYDNATLTNDSVFGMIIDKYRDSNSVVIYMSDHGEEAYDFRDSFGRHNRTTQTQEEYIDTYFMIPAMVWMSPQFRVLYPDKVKSLREAAGRRGSIDEVGYLILGLSEISTPAYRADRDIASPSYRPLRRRTNEDFFIDGK